MTKTTVTDFLASDKNISSSGALVPTPPKLKGGESHQITAQTNDSDNSQSQFLPALCGFDYFSATGWVYKDYQTVEVGSDQIQVGTPDLPATLKYLRDLINSYWGNVDDCVDEKSFPFRGYDSAESWFGGRLKICWHSEHFHQRVYFSASGSVLELLDSGQQADLILNMCGIMNFRPTRLDLYFRDFDFKLRPVQLWQWAEQDFLCRFKSENFAYYSKGKKGKSGQTFYAGSRGKSGGEMFFRAYDESVEPVSPAPAIKYEVEYSGCKVKNLVNRFLNQPYSDEWFLVFCLESTIGPGVIDFKFPLHRKSLDERERVSAWDDFILGTQKIRIQGKVKKPEINAFPLVAFVHQWGKKLAKVVMEDPKFRFKALYDSLNQIDCKLVPILQSAIVSGERRLQAT